MKGSAIAVAFAAATVFATGTARAGGDDTAERIFDDAGFDPRPDANVNREIAAVIKHCAFEEMSREGPRPGQVAACNGAVERLSKRGPAATGPVLAALDRYAGRDSRRSRLYDVLARTGDTRLIEPLVNAMARITTRKLDGRAYEIGFMNEALIELTRAPVGDRVPWVQVAARSQRRDQMDLVVDWKLWAADHAGKSHAELVAEAFADARAHSADSDPARAYRAVRYLLKYDPANALGVARALAKRSDVPELGKNELAMAIEQAEEQAAAIAKSKAKASPGKQAAPKAKAPPQEQKKESPSREDARS
jgi:hypothetical protein